MNAIVHKNTSVNIIAALISVSAMLITLSASAAEGVDAQGLIDNKCSSCHGSEMYTREDRKVNSLSALKKQVAACNSNLNAGLSDDDMAAVVALLNKEHYKFAQ